MAERSAFETCDLMRYAVVREVRVSPDGSQVAYDLRRVVEEDDSYTSAIWIVGADGSGARQLTAGLGDDTYPRWSPDGRELAFLSDRGEGLQIHVLSLDGGEAGVVSGLSGSVSSFCWAPARSARGSAMAAPWPSSSRARARRSPAWTSI